MIVLSVDVGVRHLSLCVMKAINSTDLKTYEILLWGVYDTLKEDEQVCLALQKNNETCKKICKYQYKDEQDNTVYCCKKHFPTSMSMDSKNEYKKKRIKDLPLQEVVKSVLKKLTCLYDTHRNVFDEIGQVLIELQPTFNPSMKLISHVIYGKMAEWYKDTACKIKFVRASQKLKVYTDTPIQCVLKGKYNQRKWLSKQYCMDFLEKKFSDSQRDIWFPNFKEKGTADESDTFLMCIQFLQKIH